jgi:hypothetical protein
MKAFVRAFPLALVACLAATVTMAQSTEEHTCVAKTVDSVSTVVTAPATTTTADSTTTRITATATADPTAVPTAPPCKELPDAPTPKIAVDAQSSQESTSAATATEVTETGTFSSSMAPKFDPQAESSSTHKPHIHWGPLIGEEMLWISFMHAERLTLEEKTRAQLGGPFFKDYGYILHHVDLSTWSDGGRWTTNNIYHPAEGAIFAFIYKRNDDSAKYLEFNDPGYWKQIPKAFAVSAIFSTEFEIGPESEATIGHVGLTKDARGSNGTGWTDFVMTPFGGVGMMIGEDAADKYITKRLENHIHSRPLIDTVRILTNPTRSMANVFSFQRPWHRDTRN